MRKEVPLTEWPELFVRFCPSSCVCVYKKQGWGGGGGRVVVGTFRRNAQHIDELLTIFCWNQLEAIIEFPEFFYYRRPMATSKNAPGPLEFLLWAFIFGPCEWWLVNKKKKREKKEKEKKKKSRDGRTEERKAENLPSLFFFYYY